FASATAKGPRKTQYFEMLGSRAVYDNGWIAACRHGRLPWDIAASGDFDKDGWELYNLDDDFSEANDLAAKNPPKHRALEDLFWIEAARYNVLPLDDRTIERMDPSLRPSLIEGRTKFTFFPGVRRVPESSAPNVKNRSHTITVRVEVPKDGAD